MDIGAELYRCFLNGDKEALNKLIHEYWYGLTLYLSSISQSFAEAEEMAEETFLKLYTDKPNFSGKSVLTVAITLNTVSILRRPRCCLRLRL